MALRDHQVLWAAPLRVPWSFGVVAFLVLGWVFGSNSTAELVSANTFVAAYVYREWTVRIELRSECLVIRNLLRTHHIDRADIGYLPATAHQNPFRIHLISGKDLHIAVMHGALPSRRSAIYGILKDWFDDSGVSHREASPPPVDAG